MNFRGSRHQILSYRRIYQVADICLEVRGFLSGVTQMALYLAVKERPIRITHLSSWMVKTEG